MRLMSLVMTPPTVSMPMDSGHTSSSRMSLTSSPPSPDRMPPCPGVGGGKGGGGRWVRWIGLAGWLVVGPKEQRQRQGRAMLVRGKPGCSCQGGAGQGSSRGPARPNRRSAPWPHGHRSCSFGPPTTARRTQAAAAATAALHSAPALPRHRPPPHRGSHPCWAPCLQGTGSALDKSAWPGGRQAEGRERRQQQKSGRHFARAGRRSSTEVLRKRAAHVLRDASTSMEREPALQQ